MFYVQYLLIFIAVTTSFIASADQDLTITGPNEAYEGEEVEFIVTLNGYPVATRVTFGDGLQVNWSLNTTGKVRFLMPSVPQTDCEYIVTTSMPQGFSASHTILVKNNTREITIELSTDYVIETEEFSILLKHSNQPIEGATILFNSTVLESDSNGVINVTAPDVLVTTNYQLRVNKTGYQSNATMITVYDKSKGLQLMEMIYPSIVEPETQHIEINVLGTNGGIDNVTIEVYYEQTKLNQYFTDKTGTTFIETPALNNDNYITLSVFKEGYATIDDNIKRISLLARDFLSQLEMKITPSEVYEGDLVIVEVTNDVGIPVEEARIWQGDSEHELTTDTAGVAMFIAPSVIVDKESYLFAVKPLYNFAQGTFTIRDKASTEEELSIHMENSINESSLFEVQLKDTKGNPVSDVTVSFCKQEKLTTSNGVASFYTPNITSNTFYQLTASKYGYLPLTASVEVVNVQGVSNENQKTLVICVEPVVMENQDFLVTIRDGEGNLLSDVQVTFKETQKTTQGGSVTFTAPEISWDMSHSILATKSGYESSISQVQIKNNEGFPYWPHIIAIVVILVIGLVAYFKYGTFI
jgi:hypothetical protein